MSDVGLFKLPKQRGVKRPRAAPTTGQARPEWSDYRVKTPVQCDDCRQVAYEEAMEQVPMSGIRFARKKRRQDGANLLLCDEHARLRREEDESLYGDLPGAVRSYGRVMS